MRVSNFNSAWTIFLSLLASSVMISCTTSADSDADNLDNWNTTDDYDEIEQAVFDSWIETNWPNLVDNRQEDGYYIEVISDDKDYAYPLTNATSCWIEYSIVSYDLEGNICHTRYEDIAIQQGTFTLKTRYAPTKKYVDLLNADSYEDYFGGDSEDYQESAFVQALKAKEMVIDGVTTPFDMTVGSKIKLWMPSRLIDGEGNGSYGYAGQLSLTSGRPMICEIEITNVIIDIEKSEKEVIDWFVDNQETPTDWKFVEDPYADFIYINYNYKPSTPINFINPYNYTQLEAASNFEEMEASLQERIAEAFGDGVEYTGKESKMIDDGTCYFWYIARTLDGFVTDTNIEEVKDLVFENSYGSSEDYGTRLTFDYDASYDSYIKAFFYSMPKLEYGQWATIITSSLEAYGGNGASASSSTVEILPYSTLIFHIYVETEDLAI